MNTSLGSAFIKDKSRNLRGRVHRFTSYTCYYGISVCINTSWENKYMGNDEWINICLAQLNTSFCSAVMFYFPRFHFLYFSYPHATVSSSPLTLFFFLSPI